MLAASIIDCGWLDSIMPQNGQKVLLIAEGTLMYFQEEAVKALFEDLIAKFPRSVFLFEVMGSALSGRVHPSVQCLGQDIICPWGIGDYNAMEDWSEKLTLTRADIFIDQHRHRWTWPLRILTWLFPPEQNQVRTCHRSDGDRLMGNSYKTLAIRLNHYPLFDCAG
jgi:O-methyltransferase involved in polyketide biosynthesis